MKKSAQKFSVLAQGNSMYPLLHHRDTVEYIQTPFRYIKLNDIVLVYVNDILMTHRVLYIKKNTCITRGDNNATADTTVQRGRVLAKVVRFKRKGVWYGIQDVYLTQSAMYLQEIQKLETLLQLQKIPHVFLKGVLISLQYEGSIPKRIYADCDILVPHNSYVQIEKIFALLGYMPVSLATTDSLPYFKRLEQQPEVNFRKIAQGIPIIFDVHFEPIFLMSRLPALELLYPPKLLKSLGDTLISSSSLRKIKGFNYSLCSVSDQILYLALHIFHHNFTDSVRYQLMDAVIRRGLPPFDSAQGKLPRNDIQELIDTIKEYRLEGYVYGVFVLLKKYFKTPISPSFLRAIRPSRFALYVTRFAIRHIDIFSQDSRVKAGIKRFILIFLLSPEPLWKKLFLFIHPEVLYTGVTLVYSFFALRVSQARRRFVRD